ncbi:glycoside hydrolase family 16 protein [Actinocorallia sp. B10E7]|uniref:glycoside hydrolase family 16 protein n=1 Tax=Actinocorallia sp. B10E7 TaxID=3153558 RepID=UPI00325D1B9F
MPGTGNGSLWRVTAALAGALSLAVIAVSLQPGETENASDIPTLLPEQPASPIPTEPTIELPKIKWKLSFRDEFNGTGAPSSGRWNSATGNGINGYGHKALQYYDPANVRMDGSGSLVITARKARNGEKCWYGPCTYTSGRIDSAGKVTHTYGRLAARMKLPVGKGLWPAFWTQTTDKKKARYSEIDILETIGSESNRVQGFAHTVKGRVGGGDLFLDHNLDEKFHVYGVDWTPERIVWWIDGRPYAELKRYPRWPFDDDTELFFIFNLQVGGEWPGKPAADTAFPARMYVDWIRTYHPVSGS